MAATNMLQSVIYKTGGQQAPHGFENFFDMFTIHHLKSVILFVIIVLYTICTDPIARFFQCRTVKMMKRGEYLCQTDCSRMLYTRCVRLSTAR